ncbi:MAG: gliding motility-associated C-terminal domain-containing protein [Chitinophagaceae bacterium]
MNEKIPFLFFLLLINLCIQAQICTGSLGDPVVNVTFGTGSNPGNPLSRFVSNYNYTSVACPQDGFYTIVNSTTACHSNTWHSAAEDHTPNDVNGYMMIVNASFNPGDFYLDTVRSLCPNTTYEFATWIMNVLKPSACFNNGKQPNLSFNIETVTGTKLGSYNTGDIAQVFSGAWKQYGLFFTTPPGVQNVVLRLTNNAPGGCGNDLMLDDITFRPCGPQVNAAILFNGSTTLVDVCQDDTRPFTMSASLSQGYINPAYQWQIGTDSTTFTDIIGARTTTYTRFATGPGKYYYRLSVAEAGNISSAFCRVASNVLAISVNNKPAIQASVNTPVCEGGPLSLSAKNGSVYSWTGPDGFRSTLPSPQTIATLNKTGMYHVNVSTASGCTNNDSVFVRVFPGAILEAGSDQTICEGNSILLQATDASSYQWNPGKGLSSTTIRNPIASPADSTLFTLTIIDKNGCAKTDSLRINVLKRPVAVAGTEIQIFEGQSATLNGTVKGTNISYFWTPLSFMTNSSRLNPTVTPPDNTTYTLHAVSNAGCGNAQDEVFVRVFKKVVVPNAFSPNNDGINDEWNIEALSTYNESAISVFNRYGTQVYQSKGYSRKWNGRYNGNPLPWGTYYYIIDLKNGMPVLSGWVLIVK